MCIYIYAGYLQGIRTSTHITHILSPSHWNTAVLTFGEAPFWGREIASFHVGVIQGSLNGTHFGGIKLTKQYKSMEILVDFPYPDAQCMAYIYLHLGSFGGKCRQIYHTFSI